MQEFMEGDRAKHTILPLTKFGLMQITRQRVRPVTQIDTSEVCPTCHGTGKVTSSLVIEEQIENQLEVLVRERGFSHLHLTVNPILHAYLTKGFNSFRRRWSKKYCCSLKIIPNNELSVVDYHWDNAAGLDITI
jgi:ribonuclease G